MTRDAATRSINCTSCGAGLAVLGGGRVTTHYCSYCGSELDALDDYKALRTHSDLTRPETPFRIGMQGAINGVTFTIIGILESREVYNGKVWTWIDHQVFSPTHGYGYITLDDEGHLTWTRKYRQPVRWLSVAMVERAESRPSVFVDGQAHRYYETSTSVITFAEGEFNWRPEIHQTRTAVSAMSETAMLTFGATGNEREVERTVYLPAAATYAAFGISGQPRPRGVHPLQPYVAGRHAGFVGLVAGACAAAAVAMTIYFAGSSGRSVLAETAFDTRQLPAEVAFDITEPHKLAIVSLRGDVSNSWAEIEVAVTGPDDTVLFESARVVERYSGRDSDGSWSEGSGRAELRFRPSETGPYSVELSLGQAETWQRRGEAVSTVSVAVREGASSVVWSGLAAIVFAGVTAVPALRRAAHTRRRWWRSDWVEEDDD